MNSPPSAANSYVPPLTKAEPKSSLPLAIWAVVAAFGTYFCMYAFRKPFTAADFSGTIFGDLGYKTALVSAQVLGYTASKFIGIKVISEMPPKYRAIAILTTISMAEIALLFFAITPKPYNLVFMFINGLTLGVVFGLVLGFLEGRQLTEALTAGLCASFIIASGVVKNVGASLIDMGAPEAWMPVLTGLIFFGPLLVFVWMLTRIPPPDMEDQAARSPRSPLYKKERRAFFRKYAIGLSAIVLLYLMVTILRSIRDDFAPAMWLGLTGKDAKPAYFTQTELWVALGVTFVSGLAILIRDNHKGFLFALASSAVGLVIVMASVLMQQSDVINPFVFMVVSGLGLYLPYVAVHTTVFERLIAMTRDRGNLGYLMYLADAIGYLGYVGVMISKELTNKEQSVLQFFLAAATIGAVGGLICLIVTWRYFSISRLNRGNDAVDQANDLMPVTAAAPGLMAVSESSTGKSI